MTDKKQAKFSERDSRGNIFVDCIECVRGHHGDKTCSAGFKHKKGNKGGCFLGDLLSNLTIENK